MQANPNQSRMKVSAGTFSRIEAPFPILPNSPSSHTAPALVRNLLQLQIRCFFSNPKITDIFSYFYKEAYCIRPNYCTVHSFSKLLGKLVVKYVPTNTKGTFKKKKDQRRSHQMMLMLCFCDLFLIFCIKAYVVGTHLNCIDKSKQFKWVPTTYAFVKK